MLIHTINYSIKKPVRTTMKPACQVFFGLPAFAAAVLVAVWLSAAEQQTPKPEHVNYGRPFELARRGLCGFRCRPARSSPQAGFATGA